MSPFTPAGQTRELVYRYVCQRLAMGDPPTVREVQDELGFKAVETARKHLERLVEDGRLQKHARSSRGYHLPPGDPAEDHLPAVLVPLVGRVAAGGLSEAIENREGSIAVEAKSAEGFFALKVEGESMTLAGILPGDVVIVRAHPPGRGYTGRSGDIVVALVDGEATVKTLRREGKRVELWPENPAFDPIVPPPDRLTILGKVIEVRRYLGRRDVGRR